MVVADALISAGRRVFGFLDSNPARRGTYCLGMLVLGDDSMLADFPPDSVRLANGLGSVGLPTARQHIYENLSARGYIFETVVHPASVVSPNAVLSVGVQVMAGAIIQPGVKLANNVLINTRASVDHGSEIGAHCHIAPGSTLAGDVKLGPGSHIGAGAVIIQGIELGEGTLVGAGAVVVHHYGPNSALIGVPARTIEKR